MVPWIELVAVTLVSVASALAGWQVAARSKIKRGKLAAIGFALLAWPVLCGIVPDRLYFAYPSFPTGPALFGTAFFLGGVLARSFADTALRRILQGVLAVATLYFVLAVPLWFAFNADSLRKLGGLARGGVTIQTEYYTCMPSALATVLRRWGIEASEGELAYRLRTSFQGTSPVTVPATVREIGRGLALDARIIDSTFEELLRIDRPAILVGKVGAVRHAVALMSLDEREVVIGDPLKGLVKSRREDLPRHFKWNGLAIVMTAPGVAAPRLRP